jgi:hypothetical protein
MHAPPESENPAPLLGSGYRAKRPLKTGNQKDKLNGHATQVAVITKSASAQVRVAIKCWRGDYRLELREATAVIGNCFFPAGVPVTLPITKLPAFRAALEQIETEARRLGLLTSDKEAA